jgi:phage gpG-like protein
MAGATDELDLRGLGDWAESLGRSLQGMSFEKPLKDCRLEAVASTKENFAGGHAPDGTPWAPLAHPRASGRGGDLPLRDRGLLMAATSSKGGGEGSISEVTDTHMAWGTNLEYAAIHQHGGTIVPRNAKALSIPLTKAAWSARGPRQFPGELFLFKSGKGNAFLAEAKQKGRGRKKFTELTLHYLLLQSVTIPARPFLGWNEALTDTCLQIIGKFIGEKFAR